MRGTWARALVYGAIVVLGGCSPSNGLREAPPIDPASALLADPDRREALLSAADTVVVLVYSASDCFACYGVLAGWIAWDQESTGNLHLFLRSDPTDVEARRLAEYNIDDYRVLAGDYHAEYPTSHLYVNGRLVATAPARPGRDFLLSSLELKAAQPKTAPPQAAN